MAEIQISLAAARVNAGMTQEDVAKKMGISKQTIINWEKGKPKIKRKTPFPFPPHRRYGNVENSASLPQSHTVLLTPFFLSVFLP